MLVVGLPCIWQNATAGDASAGTSVTDDCIYSYHAQTRGDVCIIASCWKFKESGKLFWWNNLKHIWYIFLLTIWSGFWFKWDPEKSHIQSIG